HRMLEIPIDNARHRPIPSVFHFKEEPPPMTEASVDQYIPYHRWQAKEGIPSLRGLDIPDMNTAELKFWDRMGGPGAFVDLGLGIGIEGGGWIVEIPAGKNLNPLRHMFDEGIYITEGR